MTGTPHKCLYSMSSSSSISVQTPLGALFYGSAWAVRIKNNWTKIKWNCVKKGYIQCYLKTAGIILAESGVVQSLTESGADAGFQVRGGALVFRVKNHNFSSILGGGGVCRAHPPPWIRPGNASLRMTVPLFVLVDCSRFWWCLERKTSGILKFLRTVSGIMHVFFHMSKMPTFQLNLKVGILLICEKHLHDRIISLESRFGHMKLVYNWSVCTKTGKWCHICVIGSILP